MQMRTTVSVDDRLLELAKRRAHERHQTLGEFVESAIQHYLGAHENTGDAPIVPVFRHGTGLVPGVDASSNRGLLDALDED
jgi:hypothetical protein